MILAFEILLLCWECSKPRNLLQTGQRTQVLSSTVMEKLITVIVASNQWWFAGEWQHHLHSGLCAGISGHSHSHYSMPSPWLFHIAFPLAAWQQVSSRFDLILHSTWLWGLESLASLPLWCSFVFVSTQVLWGIRGLRKLVRPDNLLGGQDDNERERGEPSRIHPIYPLLPDSIQFVIPAGVSP